MEFPEGNDEVVSKGPCNECGSSDGNVTYADSHQHCFVCGHRVRGGDGKGGREGSSARVAGPRAPASRGPGGGQGLIDPAAFPKQAGGLSDRRIEEKTLRRFGYFRALFNGKPSHVWPVHDSSGEVAGQRIRVVESKEFLSLKAYENSPSPNDCRLFGQSVFGDQFDKRVIICEGEIDAMSVAQEVDFKYAVVSVNGGAKAAAKNCKTNYLWLDRFDEIVVWFDDDEPGQEAAQQVAQLFEVGKVRLVKVPGFKDANELLKAGKGGDIRPAIYAAVLWRPKGIVNAKDRPADVLAPREKVLAWKYPPMMERLQEMTGGMHPGEVIYHVAGTGVGKSTALREIQFHLLEQGAKVGILSFEDTVREAKFGLMNIAASERLHLIPPPEPGVASEEEFRRYDEKMTRIHAEVFGGGKVELFDPETAEWTMKAMLGYIRYCAKALDCEVLFVDPISFVAAGIDLAADERRVLDKVAADFAKQSKELGIHIQVSHHLKRTSGVPHEEGAPTSLNELRSSGGLANFAMGVIGWERNNQAEGESWRVTRSRIIKPLRRTGKSGIADTLYYGENGRLVKTDLPFPQVGKPGGDTERGPKEWPASTEY